MTLLKLLPEKAAEQARSPAYRLPFLIAFLWILGLILTPFVDDLFTGAELSAGPVVDEVTIDRTEEADGGTSFWGSFVKKRACAFERVDWWLNTVPNVKVPLEIREGPKSRSLGRFEYGPWWVPLSPKELLENTHSVAVHDCHSGWKTKSVFWEPRK